MEGTPEDIRDRMHRYGFTEKEAFASYHIDRAEELFAEIFAAPEGGSQYIFDLYNDIYHGVHLKALAEALGRRVLERDYPEGWGRSLEGS